jgi:hypothetical protein
MNLSMLRRVALRTAPTRLVGRLARNAFHGGMASSGSAAPVSPQSTVHSPQSTVTLYDVFQNFMFGFPSQPVSLTSLLDQSP